MGFLRGVANWCRRHVPLVGGWIGSAIDMVQGGVEWYVEEKKRPIEYALFREVRPRVWRLHWFTRTIWDRLEPLARRFWRWAEPTIRNISWTLGRLSHIIHHNLLPSISDIKFSIGRIFHFFDTRVWPRFANLTERLSRAEARADEFHVELEGKAGKWVEENVKTLWDWYEWFKSEFKKFLDDPEGYIRGIVELFVKPRFEDVESSVRDLTDKFTSLKNSLKEMGFWTKLDLENFFLTFFWSHIERFIVNLFDYKLGMEKLEVVEEEPPAHVQLLARKEEFA